MQFLKGRVAVITGGSSGIGNAIARAYAAAGARVVLAARDPAKLDAAADHIRQTGGDAVPIVCDVTDEYSVRALFRQTIESLDRLDILVNSAGIVVSTPPTDEMTLDMWQQIIAVNLTAAFLCSREALKVMKKQRRGRIINIGSTSTKNAGSNSAAYAASKFGLDGLTLSLAVDGREFGIAVSIINPGNTDTPVQRGREEKMKKEGVISPKDIARIALLIADLPDDINLFDSLIIPVRMPFLGRG